MYFDIHHAAATQTVTATNSAADDLDDAFADVKAGLDGMQEVLKHSPAVAGALVAVKEGAVEPTADGVMSKVRTATGSTSGALKLYWCGDQQMSTNVCAVPGSFDMPGVR